MLTIKKLTKLIKKEINDAECYAHLALETKDTDKVLADSYYAAANDRLKTMEQFHTQVVRLIDTYKKEKGEPPAAMLAIYEYVHEEQIEMVQHVKILLNMYK